MCDAVDQEVSCYLGEIPHEIHKGSRGFTPHSWRNLDYVAPNKGRSKKETNDKMQEIADKAVKPAPPSSPPQEGLRHFEPQPGRQLPADLMGPGQARYTDSDTAKMAAAMVSGAPSARIRLLQAYVVLTQTQGNATDEEAARHAGLSLTSEYATRCSELRRAGFLRTDGGSRAGASQMERMTSVVTDAGRRLMQQRGEVS